MKIIKASEPERKSRYNSVDGIKMLKQKV